MSDASGRTAVDLRPPVAEFSLDPLAPGGGVDQGERTAVELSPVARGRVGIDTKPIKEKFTLGIIRYVCGGEQGGQGRQGGCERSGSEDCRGLRRVEPRLVVDVRSSLQSKVDREVVGSDEADRVTIDRSERWIGSPRARYRLGEPVEQVGLVR